MANSLRERRRAALHGEILQAARALILQKGYAAMSMDELAAHVGISKPTLYSYFATKEDLVIADFIAAAEQLFTYAETELNDLPPREQLVAILRTMMRDRDDEQIIAARPFSADIFQILCGNQQCVQYIQRIEELIASLFRKAIEQGEVDASLNPKIMALAFFGLVHAARTAPFFLFTVDAAMLEQTFIEFFERGIQVK